MGGGEEHGEEGSIGVPALSRDHWGTYCLLSLGLLQDTLCDKVSTIVEVSVSQATYFDIPQVGVKLNFSNKIIKFYHILGKIMQKILGF